MSNAWKPNEPITDSAELKKLKIPEMIAKAAEISIIELEDDEIEPEVETQRDLEGWEFLCEKFTDQPELLNDFDVDWTPHAKKYQDHIEHMLYQYEEIKEMKFQHKTHDVSPGNFTRGQEIAY